MPVLLQGPGCSSLSKTNTGRLGREAAAARRPATHGSCLPEPLHVCFWAESCFTLVPYTLVHPKAQPTPARALRAQSGRGRS